MKKRLLLASSSFGGGGISSYAHEVINNFVDEYEISVMVGDDSKFPIENYGVKVYHYECEDVSLQNLRNIHQVINDSIQPDVILCNNATAIVLLSPYLNNSIRIITLSHSLKYIEADRAAFNHKYVDKIIAASSVFNKEYLIHRFHISNKNKIEVIYNFVKDYPMASIKREEKQTRNSPIVIVFPGGGYPSKSPDIVLKVLNRLLATNLEFKFYWTGNTYIFMSKAFPFLRLNNIKELLPSDDRVVFTGRLPKREDVGEIYADANVFFTPSRREGCPMALIEAMRVGTISIIADYKNGNLELVDDNVNGFVFKHDDVDGIVEKIKNIILHHNRYSCIYDNSYDTYNKKLSYSVWKANMGRVLKKDTLDHKKRHGKINTLALSISIVNYRFLKAIDNASRICCESIPVLINLYKLKYKHYGKK